MQYAFNAKLGIDGRDVRIVPVGEKKYRISIPSTSSSAKATRTSGWWPRTITGIDPEIDITYDFSQ
ncbi:hypothetical protein [Tessaracoccus lapidicaptus]|uniref:hypothetical protein n=1 Tax=Tessaracoccus lapidicaptus TaxID=1427523 RepID=UPI00334178DC